MVLLGGTARETGDRYVALLYVHKYHFSKEEEEQQEEKEVVCGPLLLVMFRACLLALSGMLAR